MRNSGQAEAVHSRGADGNGMCNSTRRRKRGASFGEDESGRNEGCAIWRRSNGSGSDLVTASLCLPDSASTGSRSVVPPSAFILGVQVKVR